MLGDTAIARLRKVATWPELSGDRYTVVEELARGGMGTVYLAIDRDLGREVALKVPNGVRGADVERRLQREARVIARLEHPGIIPIHDTGRLADGRLFYVMKRVRGRTLRAHLDDLPDLGERLRLFQRICEPVAFAHAQGVIHRDLKPENIMVGAFGEVMVMDWGLARDIAADETAAPDVSTSPAHGETEAGTVVGTRGYMAPEQAVGDGMPDPRADVYSLGGILYLVLTGQPPDGARPPAAVSGTSAAPKQLRAICARCLEPDRDRRYSSVGALADDISRYLGGHAVEAYRESAVERVGRFARTYRAAILLILAYIVMRAAVAVMTGW